MVEHFIAKLLMIAGIVILTFGVVKNVHAYKKGYGWTNLDELGRIPSGGKYFAFIRKNETHRYKTWKRARIGLVYITIVYLLVEIYFLYAVLFV